MFLIATVLFQLFVHNTVIAVSVLLCLCYKCVASLHVAAKKLVHIQC